MQICQQHVGRIHAQGQVVSSFSSHYSMYTFIQGFMQDQIIASRTCFGGHMDVNCEVSLVYKLSSVSDDLKWATNTHLTPFTLTSKA